VAEDGKTKRIYTLSLDSETKPSDQELLFNRFNASDCEVYSTLEHGELVIENNVWNAKNIPSTDYEQCIYKYENSEVSLAGWHWRYPEDARGVNAYPQLIYGWKPWYPNSTTQSLPVRIGALNKLKVSYEVAVERNDGDYNLTFDNWINSSSDVTPQNIQFEFMIWEDVNQLIPFGDFQENVNTSNGAYKFYMGEPDWEPEGSNWTYLAFCRLEGREKGTVDVDELLSYLIDKGIVSPESYLASLELGNEVGNSEGSTVIRRFEVEIE